MRVDSPDTRMTVPEPSSAPEVSLPSDLDPGIPSELPPTAPLEVSAPAEVHSQCLNPTQAGIESVLTGWMDLKILKLLKKLT